ncbi:MAG TPA: oxygen-independent coproporphyrinogen III oxidase [Chlamydiales bacterium]|nr:oxygen-independent coproporphyrinogen III oxidase [Chlamydiales bacterium]
MSVTLEHLLQLNQPIPRYTSYPTAPNWSAFSECEYRHALESVEGPLSLYVHIPFCRTMCLYCGCSVVLNRRPENEARYVEYLLREIQLIAALSASKKVTEIHFGGGTPTQLSEMQLKAIIDQIRDCFEVDHTADISIEIDPRTVGEGTKLKFLQELGCNRVSFGVQDTDPKVQEAVRRRQSYEMTRDTYLLARKLQFQSINMDLIYGLPYQSVQTFRDTAEKIIEMKPDRIALFSYAKVPWLKPHQKAIDEATLPSTQEKFEIYLLARTLFCQAGYRQIGMDHFALEKDPLAEAYHAKTLHRNFQGYTTFRAEHMIGFGITSIGSVAGSFVQNVKELEQYYQAIDERRLPVHRGKTVSQEDRVRQWVILQIMCQFRIDKRLFFERFYLSFDVHFDEEKKAALALAELVEDSADFFTVTSLGELFVRNVAACFDAYLQKGTTQFSKAV